MCHRNDTIKRVAPPAKITAAANRRDRRTGGRDRGFEKGGARRGRSSRLSRLSQAVDSFSGHGLIMRISWGKVAEAQRWDRRLLGWTDVE